MSLEVEKGYLTYDFLILTYISYSFNFFDYIKIEKNYSNIEISDKYNYLVLFVFASKVIFVWILALLFSLNFFIVNNFGLVFEGVFNLYLFYLVLFRNSFTPKQTYMIMFFIFFLILFTYFYIYSRYEILYLFIFLVCFSKFKLVNKVFLILIFAFFAVVILNNLKNLGIMNFKFVEFDHFQFYDFSNIISLVDKVYTKMNYFFYYEIFVNDFDNSPFYTYYTNGALDNFNSTFDIGFLSELLLLTPSYYFYFFYFVLFSLFLFEYILISKLFLYQYLKPLLIYYLYPFFDSIIYKTNTLFLISVYILLFFFIEKVFYRFYFRKT